MSDDPFLTLLVEALNLMHPRFAAVYPHHEFYHQFRRLWDKALPVKLGLGHLVFQHEPDGPIGLEPDYLIWQLEPERRFAAVSFYHPDRPEGFDAILRFRDLGYPRVVTIGYGEEPPAAEGVTRIRYDTDRRTASIV